MIIDDDIKPIIDPVGPVFLLVLGMGDFLMEGLTPFSYGLTGAGIILFMLTIWWLVYDKGVGKLNV